MSARHLLVLCYFYPPLAGGGVHRLLGFTHHLPRHGWRSTVFCASAGDFWVMDESLVERIPRETEVVRVSGGNPFAALKWRRPVAGRRSERFLGGLRRASDWWLMPDAYAGWSRRAARAAIDRIAARSGDRPEFDAVLSSSPPDSVHLAALAIRRRFGLPWVADFRDPWMALAFRTPPTRWHEQRQKSLHAQVIESADRVLAASRTHADQLIGELGETGAARVVHLPNGYEAEETGVSIDDRAAVDDPDREQARRRDATAAAGWGGRPGDVSAPGPDPSPTATRDTFRVVYSGILTLVPDVSALLDALHDVLARTPEARRRVRVSLVGPYDVTYQDRSIALGLTPGIVEFTGPKSHRDTLALQRSADLLLLWKPRAMPTMVPGKLYEYLDAGRPLLAILDPAEEAAQLAARAGATVVAPGDRAALVRELDRHYGAWRSGAPLEARRPPWLDEHTRAQLTARLAGVLDDLVGSRS